jgi:hypothetical protein
MTQTHTIHTTHHQPTHTLSSHTHSLTHTEDQYARQEMEELEKLGEMNSLSETDRVHVMINRSNLDGTTKKWLATLAGESSARTNSRNTRTTVSSNKVGVLCVCVMCGVVLCVQPITLHTHKHINTHIYITHTHYTTPVQTEGPLYG